MISKPKIIPQTPGVYIFRQRRTPLYIGKAVNLKKRLSSYFRQSAGEKISHLLAEANTLEWIETESEIEALIKESEYIKTYIPKYNILMRDDKNYFYVEITQEKFPRILLTHQPFSRIKNQESRIKQVPSSKFPACAKTLAGRQVPRYIGPFTSGSALKETLRLLRSIFPYCTCRKPHKRPCLNAEIGRCLGYCCNISANRKSSAFADASADRQIANREEYQRNIKNIIAVLNGRKRVILVWLKREIKEAVKKEEFEKAAKIRDQIEGLENIFSHAMFSRISPIRRPLNWRKVRADIRSLLGIKVSRAEGYDISNISGIDATGSMAVFIDGRPARSEYRMFGIKMVRGANDVAMLKEVVRRRLRHPEWKYPELMLIDGGRAQLNAAMRELQIANLESQIAVVSLAKREEELYIGKKEAPIPLRTLPPDTGFFFQQVRDESHRFAKKYHHKRREIFFREKLK